MLDAQALSARLISIPRSGGPRVVLLVCDPLSISEVNREVSFTADNIGLYLYASMDPAQHLDDFDDAALAQALERARVHDATIVLVTTDDALATARLIPIAGAQAAIEVLRVDPGIRRVREPRAERGTETQDSVKAWCDLHYPDEREDVEVKVGNLAEEIGELIAALGQDPEAFAARVIKSASRSKAGQRESREGIEGEFADSQIALFDLASTEGVAMEPTLVRKMAKLRTRRPAESAERQVRKAALGL